VITLEDIRWEKLGRWPKALHGASSSILSKLLVAYGGEPNSVLGADSTAAWPTEEFIIEVCA